MTQDNDVQISGTMADYLVQKLTNEQNGEDFAIGYLKESFLTSAVQELFYARHNAHLTQEQVAQKLGKKQAAIARWEADFDGKMSLRQYVEIALACGVVPLPVQLEPIDAVREYVVDNPEAQWTHDHYISWWEKRSQSQQTTQHNIGHAFTIQPDVASATATHLSVTHQEGILTVKSVERFLKEQREDGQLHSSSTSAQQPITNTNTAFISGSSQTSMVVQPTA